MIVRLGGMFGSAYRVIVEANSAKVECLTDDVTAPVRTVAFDAVVYEPERYVAHIVMDGVERTVQVSCYVLILILYSGIRR